MKKLYLIFTLVILMLVSGSLGVAQDEIRPSPVVTGYTGFVTTFEPGKQKLVPLINPILLLPLGRRGLIEVEGEFEGEFEREDGNWEREFERELEYLQVDLFLSGNLTLVAGRFLTPFGVFNEHLHPIWIRKLQPAPIIFPLQGGSSNGVMLRGVSRITPGAKFNYDGYFSALTTVERIEAKRSAGGRWGLFFTKQRLDVGASFQRLLQEERFNAFGFDGTWQFRPAALDFRVEYARSEEGSGYWVEAARRIWEKAELVGRVEQFFAPTAALAHHEEPPTLETHAYQAQELSFRPQHEGEEEEAIHENHGTQMVTEKGDHHGVLPEVNTKGLTLGWNYYFRDGLKSSFSYGRTFSSEGDRNIWTLGLAFRLY